MFCKCGTYFSGDSICAVCKSRPVKESITYEKYYTLKPKVNTDDKGAMIAQVCAKCGSEKMYYKAVQLRSADEGQTIFYECKCGYKMTVHS